MKQGFKVIDRESTYPTPVNRLYDPPFKELAPRKCPDNGTPNLACDGKPLPAFIDFCPSATRLKIRNEIAPAKS